MKTATTAINGLYAITPDEQDSSLLLVQVDAALRGGARLLQYRNKDASPALRRTQAMALLALCRTHGVPLIINDHLELCLELDADGIHLGAEDDAIAAARARLGPAKLIGASCYNRLELALQAQTQGADYIAFGSCFDSATKPAAVRAPLPLLGQAAQQTGLPVVAIGGITAENAHLAIQAGAAAIAVIGALWTAPDIRQAAQHFSNLFNT
jgi:thiamine-phosphate pyrophosphorylase